MNNRVVITGIGVVAPNGTGVEEFHQSIRDLKSGVEQYPDLAELNFGCQLGAKPTVEDDYKASLLPPIWIKFLENNAVIYGCLAGLEAWQDAGLERSVEEQDVDSGIVYGGGATAGDVFMKGVFDKIDTGQTRRLGTRIVTQSMNSAVSAHLNNIIGFGNRVMSNSSACITGSEAVILGFEHIKSGRAKRMLCGGSEGGGRYIWGGFDAMRVLCRDSNDRPEFGSRPMSATSTGFVPGEGGGALILEDLDSALARGAKIYGEILGGEVNTGGQRVGGSMTAPNSKAVQRCIINAYNNAGVKPDEIDLVSGHLTSTMGDPIEIKNWIEALGSNSHNMPFFNAPKAMFGHCIAGAGAIELVGCILQLENKFVHGNLNSDELHPEIAKIVPREKIPLKTIDAEVNTLAKANFGFGDVNSCVIIRKFES